MSIYDSIIDMLQQSINQHPQPTNDYEKGFLAGIKEAIEEIKIAKDHKE